MEPFRKNLGLPVPRLAIRQVRESAQWAGHYGSFTRGRAAGELHQIGLGVHRCPHTYPY